MSIDPSLKIKGALKRHRNVLSRAERIKQLKDDEKWTEQDSVLALPKVAHRKSHAGRKTTQEEVAKEEAAMGVEVEAAETPEKEEKES